MITGKLNMSAIDTSQMFDGKKGKYLDIVLIETPQNQYGDDYMIVQGLSKEQRQAGKKGAILGNARIFKRQESPRQEDSRQHEQRNEPKQQNIGGIQPPAGPEEDVPF